MKNRASTIEGLLQNYKIIDEVINAAENSEGSAKKENEKYLESIEGKMNQLTNAVQEFWHVVLDTGAVGKVIDFLTNFVNLATDVVEKIGVAPTILGSIGISIGGIINLLNLYDHRRGIFGLLKDYANDSDIIKNLDLTSASLRKLTNVWSSLGEVVKLTGKAMSKWFLALPTTVKGVIVAVGAVTALATAIYKIYDATHISDKEAVEISEKAKKSIEEINREFNEGKKVVNSYFEEYKKLSKGVDISTNTNLSLSEDEYQKYLNICNEITEAYPQLKKGTDENGNAILDLGDSSQEAANKLQSFIDKQEDLKNIEISNHLNELFSGVGVQISQAKERLIEFDNKAQELEKRIVYLKKILSEGFQFDGAGNLIITPEFEENKDAMALAFENFYNELPEQRQVDLEDLFIDATIESNFTNFKQNRFLDNELTDYYDEVSVQLNKQLNQASSEYTQNRTSAAQEENFIKYTWQDSLNYLNDSMTTMDAYKGLSDGTQTIASALVKNLDSSLNTEFENSDPTEFILRNVLLPLLELPAEKQAEIDQAYNELLTLNLKDLSNENVKAINDLITQIATIIGKDPIEIRTKLGFDVDEAYQKSYYNSIAETTDKFQELSVADAEGLFSELGIDSQDEIAKWNETILKVGTLTEAVKEYKDLVNTATPEQMISQINGLSSGFEHLDKIMESIKDEDPFDYSLLADDAMAEFKELGGDAYKEFYETVSANPKDLKKCQDAFNNLVTEWIDGKGALEGLSEETKQLSIDMLKNMGIINAEEVVTAALTKQKAELAWETRDYTNNISDEIEELLKENEVTEEAKNQWYAYFAQKLMDAPFSSVNDIKALEQIVKALGIGAAAWRTYYDARSDMENLENATKRTSKRGIVYYDYTDDNGVKHSVTQDAYNEKIAEIEGFEKEIAELVNVDYSYAGGPNTNGSSGSEPKEEEIDWIERKKEILQRLHDVQEEIANDENASYGDRAAALDYLIEKDKERVDVAKNAVTQYENAYKEASKDLTEEDRKFIEEGGDIIKKYNAQDLVNQGIVSSVEAGEEYIDNLKLSQDCYDKMIESQKEELAHQKESIEHQKQKIQLLKDQIETQQDLNDALTSHIESQKEMGEIQGKYIGEDHYQKMIEQSKVSEELHKNTLDYLYEELALATDDSEERARILVEIENCKNEIYQCQIEQEELNETIKRLPIERIQMFRDLYSELIEDMDNYRSIQDKLGLKPSKEELQTYIDLYSDQIDSAIKQQEELKKLLENYQHSSEKFKETSAEIQELDNEITSLIGSQIELNYEMLQIPIVEMSEEIEKLGTYKDALNNAIAEDNAKGLQTSVEQYAALHNVTLQQLSALTTQKNALIELLTVYDEESEHYKETQSQIAQIDQEMSSLVQDTHNWNAELLNIPIEQLEKANENLSSYSSILGDALTAYDSALAGINTLIDNEIEGYQEQLDLMEEENEARKVQLSLEQALANLRKAEEQRTTQVK